MELSLYQPQSSQNYFSFPKSGDATNRLSNNMSRDGLRGSFSSNIGIRPPIHGPSIQPNFQSRSNQSPQQLQPFSPQMGPPQQRPVSFQAQMKTPDGIYVSSRPPNSMHMNGYQMPIRQPSRFPNGPMAPQNQTHILPPRSQPPSGNIQASFRGSSGQPIRSPMVGPRYVHNQNSQIANRHFPMNINGQPPQPQMQQQPLPVPSTPISQRVSIRPPQFTPISPPIRVQYLPKHAMPNAANQLNANQPSNGRILSSFDQQRRSMQSQPNLTANGLTPQITLHPRLMPMPSPPRGFTPMPTPNSHTYARLPVSNATYQAPQPRYAVPQPTPQGANYNYIPSQIRHMASQSMVAPNARNYALQNPDQTDQQTLRNYPSKQPNYVNQPFPADVGREDRNQINSQVLNVRSKMEELKQTGSQLEIFMAELRRSNNNLANIPSYEIGTYLETDLDTNRTRDISVSNALPFEEEELEPELVQDDWRPSSPTAQPLSHSTTLDRGYVRSSIKRRFRPPAPSLRASLSRWGSERGRSQSVPPRSSSMLTLDQAGEDRGALKPHSRQASVRSLLSDFEIERTGERASFDQQRSRNRTRSLDGRIASTSALDGGEDGTLRSRLSSQNGGTGGNAGALHDSSRQSVRELKKRLEERKAKDRELYSSRLDSDYVNFEESLRRFKSQPDLWRSSDSLAAREIREPEPEPLTYEVDDLNKAQAQLDDLDPVPFTSTSTRASTSSNHGARMITVPTPKEAPSSSLFVYPSKSIAQRASASQGHALNAPNIAVFSPEENRPVVNRQSENRFATLADRLDKEILPKGAMVVPKHAPSNSAPSEELMRFRLDINNDTPNFTPRSLTPRSPRSPSLRQRLQSIADYYKEDEKNNAASSKRTPAPPGPGSTHSREAPKPTQSKSISATSSVPPPDLDTKILIRPTINMSTSSHNTLSFSSPTSTRRHLDEADFSTRIDREIAMPEKVEIPERYAPSDLDSESEDENQTAQRTAEEEREHQKRLEKVRNMVNNFSMQDLTAHDLLVQMHAPFPSAGAASAAYAKATAASVPKGKQSDLVIRSALPQTQLGTPAATTTIANALAADDSELTRALALERNRRQEMLVVKHQLAAEASKKMRDTAKARQRRHRTWAGRSEVLHNMLKLRGNIDQALDEDKGLSSESSGRYIPPPVTLAPSTNRSQPIKHSSRPDVPSSASGSDADVSGIPRSRPARPPPIPPPQVPLPAQSPQNRRNYRSAAPASRADFDTTSESEASQNSGKPGPLQNKYKGYTGSPRQPPAPIAYAHSIASPSVNPKNYVHSQPIPNHLSSSKPESSRTPTDEPMQSDSSNLHPPQKSASNHITTPRGQTREQRAPHAYEAPTSNPTLPRSKPLASVTPQPPRGDLLESDDLESQSLRSEDAEYNRLYESYSRNQTPRRGSNSQGNVNEGRAPSTELSLGGEFETNLRISLYDP